MLSMSTKTYILIIFLALFLIGCNPNIGSTTMNPLNVKIKIGEQGAQFLQRNNLPENFVTKQPAGLNFYRYRWPAAAQGVAIVEHGSYGFQIPHALSIVGMEDVDHLDEGLADFTINAGITAADTLSHDEARREFMAMLQKLLAVGWKPLIPYGYPRLSGEEAFRYYEEDDSYGLPPNYTPTLAEWMRIDFDNWYLYADNVFLEIKFRRGVESQDPAVAAYLVIFNVHSAEAEAKAQFEGEDREHWRDLWVNQIKALKKERYAKESELKARGFTIFTEYQEPKLHPDDPVEP